MKKSELRQIIREEIKIFKEAKQVFWGLDNIHNILDWMYKKNILSTSEKTEMDIMYKSIMNYEKTGKLPKILKDKGINKDSTYEETWKAVDDIFSDFSKTILSNYFNLSNRTKFRYDEVIKELSELRKMLKKEQYNWLVQTTYKSVGIPIVKNNKDIHNFIIKIENSYKELMDDMTKVSSSVPVHLGLNVSMNNLKEKKRWNNSLEGKYKKLVSIKDDLLELVNTLFVSFKNLRKENLI